MFVRLIVIAKSPLPGRSKTRLCPPCTPEQAAELAAAALADTLAAVAATECAGRLLVLEGPAGEWLPDGFEVVEQCGGTLGDRLADAFSHRPAPALLVGMDTPQLTPARLADAIERLTRPDVDAVLGPAEDGGYWAIGFRRSQPRAFAGVPMSSARTGAIQHRRLLDLGLRVEQLPAMRDVDEIADARAVASAAPESSFARTLRDLKPSLVERSRVLA